MPKGETTNFPVEGEPAFTEDEGKETPEAPSAENKPEGEEPPQEGDNTPEDDNVPFHRHPRWKQLYAEKKELESKVNELTEKLDSGLKEVKQSIPQQTTVPEWFREAFGDNAELYAKYRKQNESEREEIKKEIREEMSKQSNEDRKWEDWVKTQLDTLKGDGEDFDRNELMKFASDYTVVGEDGNIDFRKALDLMRKVKGNPESETAKAKRKLVSVNSAKGDSEPSKKDFFTPADLRKKGWDEI